MNKNDEVLAKLIEDVEKMKEEIRELKEKREPKNGIQEETSKEMDEQKLKRREYNRRYYTKKKNS
jgi:hypothetical protein